MVSSTGQITREFYCEKKAFGHFSRFKASNPALTKDANVEFLDRK